MYLTKIEMSLSVPAVRAALGDAQKMHRLVSGFFQCQRKDAEVQYRCRNRDLFADLYLYSAIPVAADRLLRGMRLVGQRDLSSWLENMSQDAVMRFQLVTCPFRKVAEDGVKNSRRRALRTQEERFSWLSRKGEQGGFQLLSVTEAPAEKLIARHPADCGGQMTIDAYCYTGVLRITDAARFRQTVRRGIGAEKAYGLGMLMLMGG